MNKSLQYESLKFHNLDINIIDDIELVINKCEEILYEIRTKFDFTTHFYKDYNSIPDTLDSLLTYNGGNCITLSKLAILLLRTNNINATLIPTTIPARLQRLNQMQIAHCACCIFIVPNIYIIVDPAFYFITPIVAEQNFPITPISTRTKNDTKVNSTLLTTTNTIQIDNHILPANTNYIECTRNDDIWYYFLIGIENVDQTICLNHKHCLDASCENIYVPKKKS